MVVEIDSLPEPWNRTFLLERDIDVSKSYYEVSSFKVEIHLFKTTDASWTSLESKSLGDGKEEALKKTDQSSRWTVIERMAMEEEAEDANNQSVDAFFKKLYAGADEDTRRAMQKSFVCEFKVH